MRWISRAVLSPHFPHLGSWHPETHCVWSQGFPQSIMLFLLLFASLLSPALPAQPALSTLHEFHPPSTPKPSPGGDLCRGLREEDEDGEGTDSRAGVLEKEASHSRFKYFSPFFFFYYDSRIQYKVLGPGTGLPGHKIYIHSWT